MKTPAEYAREFYQRHKERLKAERRDRYARNRETILDRERAKLCNLQKDPVAHEAFLEHRRQKRAEHSTPERLALRRQRQREWEAKNREQIRARTKLRRQTLRLEAIAAYGGVCACCGETSVEFLAIDHIKGGGRKHRLSLPAGQRREFCALLKKLGYPAEYRVLCHNCNQSLGLYGYCPHQKNRAKRS